jgi:hypothetical protein
MCRTWETSNISVGKHDGICGGSTVFQKLVTTYKNRWCTNSEGPVLSKISLLDHAARHLEKVTVHENLQSNVSFYQRQCTSHPNPVMLGQAQK